LLNAFQESGSFNSQGFRNPAEHAYGRAFLVAFEEAHIGAVNACDFGQAFLAEPRANALFANFVAYHGSEVTRKFAAVYRP